MQENFSITCPEFDVALRTITPADLENLREWKNTHRFSFFYQEIITPEQQAQWFQGYLERAHDYMFVAQSAGHSVGCLGFRMLDQRADIYNVILGRSESGGKGLMSQAIRLLCSFIAAEFTRAIGAHVLLSNPARAWYQKNAFYETRFLDTYVEIQLDWTQFRPCAFQKI
ncbi:MAG: GNAT family N-acetyltransferase [Anaerolineales bacterium]|nr:GNAT family N-acetyltransferase [Anaerolineales bacterium]